MSSGTDAASAQPARWASASSPSILRDLAPGHHRRAADARERAELLRARVREVTDLVRAARLRNCALRDWSAAIRVARPLLPWTGGAPVRWMRVEGDLQGRRVWGRWQGGRLSGDPGLLTHARLLADLGTVFVNDDPPATVRATLEGPPAAVMLTLAAACDHVTCVDFEVDEADEG